LPLLVSDRHDWHYVGVTHEFIVSDTARSRHKLQELSVTHFADGTSRKEKFQRDIQLLKGGLKSDPENARNVFYLAQSYRDIGNLPQAIEWYEKRASLGGWGEEVWHSLYQVARMQHRLGLAWPLVLTAYLDAYQFRPSRLEPLFHLARYYRETGQYHLGHLYARAVNETPYPDDLLFIEKSIYDYELLMEHALCCDRLGKHDEADRARDAVIANADTPEQVRREAIQARRQLSAQEGSKSCDKA
jgi:tetratricopeptide (TPR) repeat protein